MSKMRLIVRWHGEKDPISLKQYAQIPNLYGIVTSLYHLPLGVEWEEEAIRSLVRKVESYGLKLELVDSFRIHEDIKRGYDTRDALIENYKKNIRMLAKCGVKLALHPDDPPRPIFGLPRIAKNVEDYRRILGYRESPANAITFCCGSFGSGAENDMPAMIREFGKEKIPFVHFRNIKRMEDGSFYECGHVTESGSSDMGEVMRALHDIGFDGYLRPDHGRRIWDEAWRVEKTVLPDGTQVEEHRPDGFGGVKPADGYGLFDRALGAMYAVGLWEGISKQKQADGRKE